MEVEIPLQTEVCMSFLSTRMKITIARHGETEENLKGIIQGHLPGKLSKLGKEQAKKLALRLKDGKFDVVFSSDLKRAKDTIKEIMKYHKDVPIFYNEELRERYLSVYQGKKKSEINWDKIKDEFNMLDGKPGGVESFREVEKRAKKFLDRIHKKYLGKKILIVAHGGSNIVLRNILLKRPLENIYKDKAQTNTGIDILEIDEQKNPKIILLNCTKHLE